jgi:hypothetical protein
MMNDNYKLTGKYYPPSDYELAEGKVPKMMYKVYYMLPKQHPIFVAEFDDEEYAQVVVDAGNSLYSDGREFWAELEEEQDESTEQGTWKRVDVDDWKFIPFDTRY